MKAIVTGGCGFIGSHLAEKLSADGIETVVIDNLSGGRIENIQSFRNRVKFIESDLADAKGSWTDVIQKGDWIFHLAALADIVPSIQNPISYFNANVVATQNLVDLAHRRGVARLVYSASSSCYGIPTTYPTSENAPIAPEYPYALTKRLGEEIVLHWAKVFNLPAVSLRLFNVYGPRARTNGTYGAMFGTFLAQKLSGRPLTVVGDGEQTRDFVFVSDVVEAFLAAARSSLSSEIFNVGSGRTVAVNYIVKLLDAEKVHIPKRPGEPDSTFASIEKIQNQLSWSPRVSIEDGVRIMLGTLETWAHAPVWDAESIARETAPWFRYLGKETPDGQNRPI